MNSTAAVLLFLVVIAAGFQAGQAIQCYVCNSHSTHEGEVCADPFDPRLAASRGLLKDCSDLPEDARTGRAHNYTLCRKFVQDIDGDFRIERSCATAGRAGKCIDRTGTAKIKLQYCECANAKDGEACNFASQLVSMSKLALGLTTGVVLFSTRLFK